MQSKTDNFIGLNDVHTVILENEKTELTEEEFQLLTATIEGTVNTFTKALYGQVKYTKVQRAHLL